MGANSNPVFRRIDHRVEQGAFVEASENTASWKGIITKTFILIATAIVAGIVVWFLPFPLVVVLLGVGVVMSFISVFIAMRNPAKAMTFGIIYALFQGITYGTLTWLIEMEFPGVGAIALGATFGILLVMAGLHSIGAVRATPRLIRFVMGVLLAVLLSSLVMLIGTLINPTYFDAILENFALMIIVSAFLIIVGALMLIIDFDNAKNIVNSGAPKEYEWQVGLGIMITLVWIYLRVLRFIMLLVARSKD